MKRKCLAVGIILLFIGIAYAPAIAQDTMNTPFVSMTKTMAYISDSARDEIELKYYEEEGLQIATGVGAGVIWKTAIRLTQMEIGPYMKWTLTKINVAFRADQGCSSMMVRIYIYDKGNDLHPGPILANDTTFTLNTTGVTTIPLLTSIDLSGHEELWVAVEWHQNDSFAFYAWMDTLSGHAVDGKGDWYYLNNIWSESQTAGPDYDGNWGIGAIVEGLGSTELSIGNIQGPIGVTSKVSNIGGINMAKNVSWSLEANGGLFHKVTVLETGMVSEIDVDSFIEIETGIFFGFGYIDIIATAKAENAVEVIATKTGFLFGPFVI